MREVDVEKFFADYDALVTEKECRIAEKDEAIRVAKENAERVIVENGYSETVKEMLISEVVKEEEVKFDITEIEGEMAKFEKYFIIKEEVCEEVPNEDSFEGEIPAEEVPVEEVPVDAPIAEEVCPINE